MQDQLKKVSTRVTFGETAGRQCACNAFYALCWSVVRIYAIGNILI